MNSDAAQIFAKKCAELLSLAMLLDHGDIILPTMHIDHQLPPIVPSHSTGKLKSKFSSKDNIVNSPYGVLGSQKRSASSSSVVNKSTNGILNSLLYRKIVDVSKKT